MNTEQKNFLPWAILIFIAALVMILIFTYISYHNTGVRYESSIGAKYEDNQNVLSQYSLKIGEMAQIPEMYSNDLRRLTSEALDARYGEEGSRAMFQWIKEQNPTLDVSVYKAIQTEMVAGRNAFQNSQTALLDVCREYTNATEYAIGGALYRFAGFPRAGTLDKKCIVIKSSYAKKAYDTGIDDGIKLKTDVDKKIDTPHESKDKF